MAIHAKDYVAKLPKMLREAIQKRGDELIAEEMTLRQLREVRERSQVELGRKLGIKQAAVSKLERRADMYLSTLRKLVEAMGGSLEIVARFPDRPPVRISHLESIDSDSRAPNGL
jgi:transcriptional regulator with XRE-family HTH domain